MLSSYLWCSVYVRAVLLKGLERVGATGKLIRGMVNLPMLSRIMLTTGTKRKASGMEAKEMEMNERIRTTQQAAMGSKSSAPVRNRSKEKQKWSIYGSVRQVIDDF